MTLDILTNVYQNNLDTVYIVSGDGDFIPLIKECIRFGKHVHVAALSSGLSPELRYEADQFLLLDNMYTQIGDQGAVAAEQAQDN